MVEDKNAESQGPQLLVHNVFLKDVSFEVPNTPEVFTLQWKPKVDFDLDVSSRALDNDLFECIIDVTLTVKVPKEEEESAGKAKKSSKKKEAAEDDSLVAFLVEVKQGGLFTISGYEDDKLEQILATAIPNIIFPYARESVANLVMKGGFPQLVLPPVNFDAMYREHQSKKEDKKEAANN